MKTEHIHTLKRMHEAIVEVARLGAEMNLISDDIREASIADLLLVVTVLTGLAGLPTQPDEGEPS